MRKAATFTAAVVLAGCGPGLPDQPTIETYDAAPAAKPASPPEGVTLASVGLSSEALDRSADPCSDFYRYACGGWIDKTEIPADKPRWVRSFNEIHERNEKELRAILEAAAANPKSGDDVHTKIGRYYAACMDEASIAEAGLTKIQPLLDRIAKIRDDKSLLSVVTELHRHKIWALFDIDAEQDFKDATKMIAFLDQNGLGLPDRDYYVKEDDKSKTLRDAYVAHVERMLELGGYSAEDAKRAAQDVMQIETQLAEASKTRVERRDPKGLYNKVDRAGLVKLAPKLDWAAYFAALEQPKLTEIAVTAPKYFSRIDSLLHKTAPAAWRNYFTWHVLHSLAPALPEPFVQEDFALTQLLTGQPEQRVRWKRCVSATDAALGEALAQPFIERRFRGASKAAAEEQVHAISDAFGKRLDDLDWMGAATRARADEKLQAMEYLIGYPDKWKTYDFAIEDAYVDNLLAAQAFDLRRELDKIGKPVDRGEWSMSPPTVNAYYNPLRNHMVFPAGILQPPFYDVDAAVAVNLGGMGFVVGHELTHGFDDQGSQFDEKGNLADWWEPKVAEAFKKRTKCVEDLYAGFTPAPGLSLNGELTKGENIADLGGVKLAFAAYRGLRAGEEPIVAEGHSEDQLFFLASGQVWCSKLRDEYLRLMVQTDPHSPPQYRVNGPLSQLPEFAEAFECSEGTPMHPKEVCSVW
jgi:putative endopeptidase